MNIDVTGIFQTYIAHTHVSDHEVISQGIQTVMDSVPNEMKDSSFNFWEYCHPEDKLMTGFKEWLCSIVGAVNKQVEPESDSYFEVSSSWCNQSDIHYETPHHHSTSKWAVVYYLSAPEGSGDLLLLDPRGGVYAEKNNDGGRTNRAYKRLTPQTGSLVVLPGYLLHMVEPCKSNVKRLSFATLFKEKNA